MDINRDYNLYLHVFYIYNNGGSMSGITEAEELIANIEYVFNKITDGPTNCKSCGKKIWFLKHKATGKSAPYTNRAESHFKDCPYANHHSKSSKVKQKPPDHGEVYYER